MCGPRILCYACGSQDDEGSLVQEDETGRRIAFYGTLTVDPPYDLGDASEMVEYGSQYRWSRSADPLAKGEMVGSVGCGAGVGMHKTHVQGKSKSVSKAYIIKHVQGSY